MKEGATFFDKVITEAQSLNREVVERVVEMVPRLPGQRKLTQREQLERYINMTPQEMESLVRRHGEAATSNYVFNMERLRRKLARTGGKENA